MSIEITVPKLPESVADATLVTWHKKPGDSVARDENLADLETDKVVLEVPAPAAGVLTEIKIAAGTTVTSGQILALFEAGAAGAAAPAAKPAAAPATGIAKVHDTQQSELVMAALRASVRRNAGNSTERLVSGAVAPTAKRKSS